MPNQSLLRGDPLPWLLEPSDAGVCYLALRDLCGLALDDPQLAEARMTAHRSGPIATVLDAMNPSGFWIKAGPGYSPKYRSTVWALILLAELGASVHADMRVATACHYLLGHALAPGGQFTYSGAAAGTIDCLQGNLCWSLSQLGCEDARLATAYDWMARSVTGEDIAPSGEKLAANSSTQHYYPSLKCGPCFACRVNNNNACAWGAVKVMLALSTLPAAQRTPQIERAIVTGIDFLLSIDPVTAAYPTANGRAPNGSWWALGFPVFYVSDLLQLTEALVNLGYGHDLRLAGLLSFIAAKQDEAGRWKLEYSYSSKTWVNFGRKSQPNKWVTLRARRLLQQVV